MLSDTRLSGHHVSCLDVLGRRACSLAYLPHWTGSLGPDERRSEKVSSLVCGGKVFLSSTSQMYRWR